MDPLGLGSAPEGGMSRADGARKALDDLATVVRAKAPGLFAARDGGDTGRNREKLEALSQVLYEDTKLRADPFEWVYEGLAPMLLSDVLQRRSGAPAALAIAAAAVGRRVGLPLLPLPAAPIEAGAGSGDDGASAGLPPLDSLPPDLALRLSTRTQAVAPGPGPWVLRFDPGIDLTSKVADEAAIYVDAGSGEVMEGVAVRERYPALAGVSGEGWREQSVLRTWQGLARLAIQAHQRRGESDHVAHWVYLTLALDPQAPEWAHAMAAPELSA